MVSLKHLFRNKKQCRFLYGFYLVLSFSLLILFDDQLWVDTIPLAGFPGTVNTGLNEIVFTSVEFRLTVSFLFIPIVPVHIIVEMTHAKICDSRDAGQPDDETEEMKHIFSKHRIPKHKNQKNHKTQNIKTQTSKSVVCGFEICVLFGCLCTGFCVSS
jgi:hypothetical protein